MQVRPAPMPIIFVVKAAARDIAMRSEPHGGTAPRREAMARRLAAPSSALLDSPPSSVWTVILPLTGLMPRCDIPAQRRGAGQDEAGQRPISSSMPMTMSGRDLRPPWAVVRQKTGQPFVSTAPPPTAGADPVTRVEPITDVPTHPRSTWPLTLPARRSGGVIADAAPDMEDPSLDRDKGLFLFAILLARAGERVEPQAAE